MLGVNNLTVKAWPNGIVLPIVDDVSTLIEIVFAKFEIFKCQKSNMSDKILLGQLIGLNLADYNKSPKIYDLYQQAIDESMPTQKSPSAPDSTYIYYLFLPTRTFPLIISKYIYIERVL